MGSVKAIIDGWINVGGADVLLRTDLEYAEDDPAVAARPELFEAVPEPEPEPAGKRPILTRKPSQAADE